ncbi:MAG: glycosyl transferase family 2 [Sphingobacteriales bacterium UTBCD1]|jgi:cellulose synthase/poly-beta-1,6-N-acetylglucosamine synthase-like glycosyltransferase/spore germination protein YaaH/peptidoglycan/xylan/chitin deacetylase (PgdA/CDA1 family)|nr:MAG: glycosyl transferase family 2 [Sphingobacteriales bacterium UTBCD1]
MNSQKQIFQTSSRLRWNTFRWIGRVSLFFILLMVPVVWITLAIDPRPLLPGLSKSDFNKIDPTQPKGFTKKEAIKYKGGFNAFLKIKRAKSMLAAAEKEDSAKLNTKKTSRIRAAFYVDWDPQALFSLQDHISELNTVLPEWFFIDPVADTLIRSIDPDGLALMKQNNVSIIPMLSNVNLNKQDGDFDPDLLSRFLLNYQKREKLIEQLLATLKANKFQGINIDFEEIKNEKTVGAMNSFLKELSDSLHKNGLLLTQDIMPNDNDFQSGELARYNDYLFFMAYDQHYATSVPGPVSEQRWIEKELDKFAKNVPSDKIVLCMAAYGYDWPDGGDAETITYQQALSLAKEFNATIDFDNDSYNCDFEYTDYNKVHHTVSFIDAGGNFNTMRFADEYSTAGVALWRLGSEDERIWDFYGRDLSNAALKKNPFDFSVLGSIDLQTDKPDFKGNGEILDVKNDPQKGIIDVEKDSIETLVSEETYRQLPTRFFIKLFGQVHNQVLLTFDDGPDPEYTPRILSILEKEKVPAAFFVLGINAETNLPLIKRMYRDGFEIGNHTFTHPNIAEISESRAETEIEATRLLIEAATGRSTILFRAPYNADAQPTKLEELKPIMISKQKGYYTVGESIDPNDWKPGITADSIYNSVINQYAAHPDKGIILLHDAGGNREATVEALPRIIKYFKDKGIQFTSIADLLKLPRDAVMPPVHDDLVRMNGVITMFVYWLMRFLYAAFWVAIILGLLRTVSLAVMASLEYFRSKKEKLILSDNLASKVSIIVPAYNESVNAVKTIKNLLQQNYPDFEVIFVDDGSRDNTFEVISNAFANNPGVKIYTKPNGGKASALNFGIAQSSGDYVVCIDADTQLMPDAVRLMMRYFNNSEVVAVAGNVKVGNEKNILTKWQSIEYITAQNFDRRAFDYLNCISVIPGAVGVFKKSAVEEVGGFMTDTLAEDCDLTLRLLRSGGVIRNCTDAIAMTEVPETLKQFMKQRFRWIFGVMQSFWKNRDACFNPRYKSLGMMALPNILVFQTILPIVAPLADLLFFISLFWNRHSPDSLNKILIYYSIFLLVDVSVSVLAFAFEKEKMHRLVWLIPQRFVYRQLMYVILFRSISRAMKGEGQKWGSLNRTGNVVFINEKGVKETALAK